VVHRETAEVKRFRITAKGARSPERKKRAKKRVYEKKEIKTIVWKTSKIRSRRKQNSITEKKEKYHLAERRGRGKKSLN